MIIEITRQLKTASLLISIITSLLLVSACNTDFLKPTASTQKQTSVIPPAVVATKKGPATATNDSVTDADIDDGTYDASQAPVVKQASLSIPFFTAPEETQLWKRIELGMQLGDYSDHPRVKAHIDWYARHPEYLDRVAKRAEPFLFLIVEQIEKHKMPAEIALLPIVESAFQPFAYSHGRASGIWQFIPGTGRLFGLKQNWWYDGRRDIAKSTDAALKYLRSSHRRLGNDWLLALAAYNSGEGTINRAIRKNRKKGKPTEFWYLDLPPETRAYVPKLLAISTIIANPLKYNLSLYPIKNQAHVTQVSVNGQIDLALVAQLADISLEKVYQLNPAYNRWATEPGKTRKLLIPVEQKKLFTKRLAKIPASQRVKWKRHKIKRGETLSHIALRYGTSVKLLQQINRVSNRSIRQGRYLMIPVATRSLSHYNLTQPQRSRANHNRKRSGKKVFHVVQHKDTFWDLSRRYHVSIRTLAKWNGMAPGDPLKPGKKLVLWLKNRTSLSRRVNFRSPLPAATIRTIHYTVRRGDSLALISARFKVTIHQLRKWNKLPKKGYLQPGQRLKLLVDVTRQT